MRLDDEIVGECVAGEDRLAGLGLAACETGLVHQRLHKARAEGAVRDRG